ncbi:von Willebrand factor-like [Saccoglossus kowalevskii]
MDADGDGMNDLQVEWLPGSAVQIKVTQPIGGTFETRGLCGNADGNPDNDFMTPQGLVTLDKDEFGDSWATKCAA